MKTLLIPTDLSPESENAFSYAVDFAMAVPEKIQLVLFHALEIVAPDPEAALGISLSDQREAELAKREAIKLMAEKYLRATGLRCSIVTSFGSLKKELAGQARQVGADYIFMGTKGATGVLSSFFGSNTSEIIAHAPCPVLAIPEKAFFSPIRKIIFASIFSENEIEGFRKAQTIAELFNSTIVLLHISDKNEEKLDLQVLEFVRNNLKAKTGFARIEVSTVYAGDFAEGIDAELRNQQAGLLVMAPRKHNFASAAFGRSRTRKMVLQTKTPLLALPAAEAGQQDLDIRKAPALEVMDF